MEILTDDDSFGGSSEECRIFKETFHGNKTCGPVANKKAQSSCERAPLLTIKEVMLMDSSNSRSSSMPMDFKRMKSSVGQGFNEQTHSGNYLNQSVVHIESDSTILHPSSDSISLQDTFRVLEYSLFSGPSSSNVSTAAAEPCVNILGVNDVERNTASNPADNDRKVSDAIKNVTSPTSQESTGSKALLTNDGSNSRLTNKESQEDDQLFEDVSLKEARQKLFDAVTKLMGAKGWHVQIVRRNCRNYEEKVYISDTGKKVREFPKFWRLLGRSLSVNDNPEAVENSYKGWPDIRHYCKELSLTLAQTDVTINPTATDSELASIWNIFDPFVYFMYLQRKIKVMKKATFIPVFRSIPLGAFVSNRGELTYDKLDSVPKKTSGCKRKITPSDSSLPTNNGNQNENAGSGKDLSFGEVLEEGSIPKKSKNARSKCMVTSHQGGKGKNKNAGQRGDSEPSIFEKVTGMEGSLFWSSLYDVHADLIKEWGYQDGLAEQTDTVHEMPAKTVISHYSNNNDALLAFPDREMLRLSGVSFTEKEIIDSSDVSPVEDTLVRNEMLNGSVNEIENDFTNLHKVNIIWNEQEDLACGKKKVAEVDVGTMALDSKYSGAVNEGMSFSPSKQTSKLIADDDILLSDIKKKTKKRGRPPKSGTLSKLKVRKVKKKVKGRGRGRKLHTKSGGKGEHVENEKCITSGARTPLSWLIDIGVVHQDDTILYRQPQSTVVLKKGFVTKNGILCYCCNGAYSVSKFRLHAGAKSPDACSNLFMDCGKSYELCQLDGLSAEYLKRKNHKKPTRVEDEDESDDICGLCGDGGDLVCCDNCPATFHQKCLSVQEVPDGDWYCFSCVCHICGEFSRLRSSEKLKCAQCKHKYHPTCLTEKNRVHAVTGDWFCSKLCRKVHSDIWSRVGVAMLLENGYSSTLLRCFLDDDDEKAYSETPVAIRAECNTKLAVALTIMEECFLSMVDFRTGIDMIPHMVYNFGSNFPRLDFHGFFTVILEKDDAVMCVATLRIHGSSIAEIPLVATCSKYRRQGMCRLLMGAIEKMLKTLKINNIVMSAVPELVPTWVNGFGFQPVDEEDKSSLKTLNLAVFPGTVLLQKSLLLQSDPTEPITEPENSAPTISIQKQVPVTNALQLSEWHLMSSEPDN